MDVNTLEQYADTVAGEILPHGFWDKVFPNRYRKKREAITKAMVTKFHVVSGAYHGIAVQNFTLLLGNKCMDVKGKHTKKLNYAEILKVSETVKFKP